jgi:hypothetical protein
MASPTTIPLYSVMLLPSRLGVVERIMQAPDGMGREYSQQHSRGIKTAKVGKAKGALPVGRAP